MQPESLAGRFFETFGHWFWDQGMYLAFVEAAAATWIVLWVIRAFRRSVGA